MRNLERQIGWGEPLLWPFRKAALLEMEMIIAAAARGLGEDRPWR